MMDPLGDALPARLHRRLSEPLPGRRAHRLMASELAYGRHFGPPAWNAKPAAVLALLYPYARRWWVPLILRPKTMLVHAGQVALPGGTVECDESVERCAAREFEEELGAGAESVTVLGRLSSLYVFASNFWVTPCVAIAGERPSFVPDGREVARLLECELDAIMDPRVRDSRVVDHRGIRFAMRFLRCHDDAIWGATAMILAELAVVVSDAQALPAVTG